jgi:hypothetical protein
MVASRSLDRATEHSIEFNHVYDRNLAMENNNKVKPVQRNDALVLLLRIAICGVFVSAIVLPTLYQPLLDPLQT